MTRGERSRARATVGVALVALLAIVVGTATAQADPTPAASAPTTTLAPPPDTTPPAQVPADVAAAAAGHGTDVIVSFDPAAGVQAMRAATAGDDDSTHRERGQAAAASTYAQAKREALQRAGHGAATARDFDHLPVQVVHVDDEAALQRLASDPDVTAVNLPLQLSRSVDADLTQIHQPQALANGLDGAGVRVAVLDSGIDMNQGAFGTCFTVNDSFMGSCHVSRRSVLSGNPVGDTDTVEHHGTNVAAIILKVAPEARIDDYQVFVGDSASSTDIIAALNAVAADGAARKVRAVNLSVALAGDHNTSECTASQFSAPFTSLRAAGILPVVAAGNDAYVSGSYVDGVAQPACATGAVRVGAEWQTGAPGFSATFNQAPYACTQVSPATGDAGCFSQSGPGALLSVYAPGVQVAAAGQTLSGTSQAAPHVSGAIAALASIAPQSTALDLLGAITTSPTKVTDLRAGGLRQTPLLDLTGAAAQVQHLTVQAPSNTSAATAITVTVKAVDGNGAALPAVSGPLTVTSSDPGATLPSSAALAGGTATFPVTFAHNGAQTVSVTGPNGLTGTSGPITVAGGATTVATTTTTTTAPPPPPPPTTAPPAATPASTPRISGSDRIATSVAASQAAFITPDTAGAVVLASADSYPDGLAGTPLAASLHAPLLLSSAGSLRSDVRAELDRALPAGGNVYVLGGTASLGTAVTNALSNAGYQVHRVAGSDRFGTATAIADAIPSPGTVLLATGLNFPDALAAGVAAAHVHGVVLFTQGTTQASATQAWLAAHASLPVVIVGGSAAGTSPGATTLAGTDRYDTSARVAAQFFPSVATAGLASGEVFPDALSGGAHIALLGGPILLTPAAGLTSTVQAWLSSHRDELTTVYLYGGTSTVSAAVASQVASATS